VQGEIAPKVVGWGYAVPTVISAGGPAVAIFVGPRASEALFRIGMERRTAEP
jgi:hypothetical protein